MNVKTAGIGLGLCMLGFVLLSILSGCEALVPDTLTLDAAHTSHHWGETRAPYEFGKDTAGVGEHWKQGHLTVDMAEYAQDCKDGLHPEFSVRASYAIPLK